MPKLTNAQSRAREIAANHAIGDTVSKLYQIQLNKEESKLFQEMTPKKRGAIVSQGIVAAAFPWEHYAQLCRLMGESENDEE